MFKVYGIRSPKPILEVEYYARFFDFVEAIIFEELIDSENEELRKEFLDFSGLDRFNPKELLFSYEGELRNSVGKFLLEKLKEIDNQMLEQKDEKELLGDYISDLVIVENYGKKTFKLVYTRDGFYYGN